jgi:hypothetical protein
MGLSSVILGIGEAAGAGLGGLIGGRAGMDGIIGLTVILALISRALLVGGQPTTQGIAAV